MTLCPHCKPISFEDYEVLEIGTFERPKLENLKILYEHEIELAQEKLDAVKHALK